MARLPASAGLGLKPLHFTQILHEKPLVGFFEIHAENYLVAGGPFHHYLERIRAHYALSIHGVGLSIGGQDALDMQHLAAIKQLIERYQPESFSEHLAWSSHGLNYYNDLLPIAYTEAALERVVSHIEQVQDYLGRRILIENPSTYVQFSHSSMSEPEFIGQVLQRSGCGLLLDINNIYVSSRNHGWDANHYLNALGSQALASVGELHLAGFAQDLDANQEPLLIDNHGAPVDPAVWALYRQALPQVLRHGGNIATLLERDNHIPPLPVLLQECQKAQDIINESLATSTSSTA